MNCYSQFKNGAWVLMMACENQYDREILLNLGREGEEISGIIRSEPKVLELYVELKPKEKVL